MPADDGTLTSERVTMPTTMITHRANLDEIRSRALDELERADDLRRLPGLGARVPRRQGRADGSSCARSAALPAEERPAAGRAANALKQELTAAFEATRERRCAARTSSSASPSDAVDVTLAGSPADRSASSTRSRR